MNSKGYVLLKQAIPHPSALRFMANNDAGERGLTDIIQADMIR
jgi:hypothetical protein